ncbi:hypothetical protein H6F90_10800 [Trichocoleus sp. FACHB-591]|uniref:hypothetical protein n=1 Tax=Trichocoleus sp. FACHB-591 TaxID=2692872 RepID=UPI0016827FFF|nr:hypothetical protein [Trichocoleus sp. FACHB-591]MBD2095643.1 hypothetical protein [Trichocoleus sp. FACHB-591]
MRKLPFVIAPKAEAIKETVGNEEIGTLELPRVNDLSPSDRLFIRQASKDLPNLQREAVKIAKSIKAQRPTKIEQDPDVEGNAIAAELGLHEIYSALITSDTETLGEFLGEILDYQDVLERLIDERPLIMATAMLRRVEPNWTLEDTTTSVSSKLVSELNQFGLKEENGWKTPDASAEPLTDEQLGE